MPTEIIIYFGLLAFFASAIIAGAQPVIEFVLYRMPNFFGVFIVVFASIASVIGMTLASAYLAGVIAGMLANA